jgi:hypothetical protein
MAADKNKDILDELSDMQASVVAPQAEEKKEKVGKVAEINPPKEETKSAQEEKKDIPEQKTEEPQPNNPVKPPEAAPEVAPEAAVAPPPDKPVEVQVIPAPPQKSFEFSLEKEDECDPPFLYNYLNPKSPIIQPLDVFSACFFEPYHEEAALNYHNSVSIGYSIYLVGGLDNEKNASNKTVEVALNFGKLPPKEENVQEYGCHCTVKAPMNTARFFHGITTFNHKIMVVAGLTVQEKPVPSCELFDVDANAWKEVNPLPTAMGFVAVTSFDNRFVYAFGGGHSQVPVCASVYKYAISDDKWEEVSLDENQGWNGSAGSLLKQLDKDTILLFGGEGKTEPLRDSFFFDVNKKALRKAARMKQDIKSECKAPACIKRFDNKIYAAHSGKCSIYDILCNQWTVAPYTIEAPPK